MPQIEDNVLEACYRMVEQGLKAQLGMTDDSESPTSPEILSPEPIAEVPKQP